MTVAEFVQLINAGGVTVLLLIILYGGWQKWWVFGWAFNKAEAERDVWRELALRGTELAEHAVATDPKAITVFPNRDKQ